MKQSIFFVAAIATQFLYTAPDEYQKPRGQLTAYEQSAHDTVRHQSNSLWSERESFYPEHDLNTRLYDAWSMHDVTPIVHAAAKRHSDSAAAKRQEKAAKEQQRQPELSRERQQWFAAKQQAANAQEHIRHTFEAQRAALSQASKEWTQIQEIYQEYGLHDDGRYARRKEALSTSHAYGFKSYSLTPAATQLIRDIRTDVAEYQMCYGNQLQQVIHQECIDGIGRLASLPKTSVVYPYKESMATCFDAARAYNQAGAVDKATAVADFCWTLLDYGKAIAEGAVAGVVSAVEDLLEHPGQALLCAVAGKYVLAYQLGKILCNVADIGLTYAFDAERGKQQWDEYVAPATQLIDAISNKEISLRDGLKGATQFAVQLKAQDKLLRGMNKFCTTAKARALEFAKNNPLTMPEQYMVTPEGILLKASYDGATDNKKLTDGGLSNVKEKLEWTNHRFKHVPPKNLSWKEVIKATKNSDALYKPGINIKELELYAWQHGTQTTRGKNWKVFKAAEIIGANEGKETVFMRVECSANTVHGHPILEAEYWEYLK